MTPKQFVGPEDTNVYYYAGKPEQRALVRNYGSCWICKGKPRRRIVAFDRAQRSVVWTGGYANLCGRCIPTAKTLAALRGWRKL